MSSGDKVYRKNIFFKKLISYFSCSYLWVDLLLITKLTSCNKHLHVPLYLRFFKKLTGRSRFYFKFFFS
ncbi:hypothetical protein E2C01_015658 [Portunus trituberculatus]|uniref:Uncharacterized protein n=1 Tax=Portunus trituberculatus TaxID=210409 RepID=A0A5B7DMH7_PORTR|nr:hypothetical protein [Portunus trituberculatus]